MEFVAPDLPNHVHVHVFAKRVYRVLVHDPHLFRQLFLFRLVPFVIHPLQGEVDPVGCTSMLLHVEPAVADIRTREVTG